MGKKIFVKISHTNVIDDRLAIWMGANRDAFRQLFFPPPIWKKTKSTCKKGRTRGLVICTQINNTNSEKRNKFITLTDEERPNDP